MSEMQFESSRLGKKPIPREVHSVLNDFHRELEQLLDEAALKQHEIQSSLRHQTLFSTSQDPSHKKIDSILPNEIQQTLQEYQASLKKMKAQIRQQGKATNEQLTEKERLERLIQEAKRQQAQLSSEKSVREQNIRVSTTAIIEQTYQKQVESHQLHYEEYISDLTKLCTILHEDIAQIEGELDDAHTKHKMTLDQLYTRAQEAYRSHEQSFREQLVLLRPTLEDNQKDLEQSRLLSDFNTCRTIYQEMKYTLDEKFNSIKQEQSELKNILQSELNQADQAMNLDISALQRKQDELLREARTRLQQHSHSIYGQIHRETEENIRRAVQEIDAELTKHKAFITKELAAKTQQVKRKLEQKGREYRELRLKQHKTIMSEYNDRIQQTEKQQRKKSRALKEDFNLLMQTTRDHINALHTKETEHIRLIHSKHIEEMMIAMDPFYNEMNISEQIETKERRQALKELQEEKIKIGQLSGQQLAETARQQHRVVREMREKLSQLNNTLSQQKAQLKEERLLTQKQLNKREREIDDYYSRRVEALEREVQELHEAIEAEFYAKMAGLKSRFERIGEDQERIRGLKVDIAARNYSEEDRKQLEAVIQKAEEKRLDLLSALEATEHQANEQRRHDKDEATQYMEKQRARLDVNYQRLKEEHTMYVKEKMAELDGKEYILQNTYQSQINEIQSENEYRLDLLRTQTQQIEKTKRETLRELQQNYYEQYQSSDKT